MAALAVSSLLIPLPLVGLLAVALVVSLVVDAAWVWRAPGLHRTLQEVVVRGLPSPLRVEVRHDRPGAVRVRQAVPADVTVTPAVGNSGLDAELTAKRRGRHHLPDPATRLEGPLKLAARHHRHPASPSQVRVYPDLPRARRIATAVRRGEFDVSGVRLRGPLGLGTDFESIREYLPDDDIRQVNWRATARVGKPMSNQFRVDLDRDVICAVDCGRLMAAPLGDRTRLDAAMDAALAVVAVADVLDDRAGAIAFDAALRRHLVPRRKGAGAIATALYDVEPAHTDSDYELAFRAIGSGKRSFVLVLTDLLDESAARPLLEAVPIVARKHSVVIAGATDPDLQRLASLEEGPGIDGYRAVVARDVLEARRLAARRLRAAGAQVLEAAPHRLPAACVSAYLRAKAGARV